MSIPAQTADVEAFLASEMQRHTASGGVTKRSAARLAIASAITHGVLPKGSLIPTEKRLTTVLGVSLGTVQAALQQLQQSSIIVRRRGDGTRVASSEALGRDTWHFRLLARESGLPVRISKTEVDVEITSACGPWSTFLEGFSKFIRIRRRIVMTGNIRVGAEMYLPHDLVPEMEHIPPGELKMINIRPFLAEKHDYRIAYAEHEIAAFDVHDLDARRLALSKDMRAFEITARAYLADARPGYWQRILVPCDRCKVTF